ncbi:MAG: ANTAR domain-containing protein [Clostridia bacterium]|nr:ANTAR domain-containing protein [Clostridia bacterium]
MKEYQILVADSAESTREKICKLLNRKGYKTYHATDGAGTIRMARKIRPHIVILDTNIWGINAFEVARIIEADKLAVVVFMTNNPGQNLYERLRKMTIFAYITKPISPDQLYQITEFAIMNSNRIKVLNQKVEKLENTLEGRKKVDQAKGLLIERLGISEKEAYEYIRKKSMDLCKTMDKVAEEIIKKF